MALERIGLVARHAATISSAALMLLGAQASTLAESQTMDVIARSSSGALRCEIRKGAGNNAVELTGVVSSGTTTSGRFQYKVVKSGPSGSSNINQASKFALAAGAETRVGQVQINLDGDTHVTIELEVMSDDGSVCVASASL
jgi:hypothetical protein